MDRAIDKWTFFYRLAVALYLSSAMLGASIYGSMNIASALFKVLRILALCLLIWKAIEDNRFSSCQVLKYGICFTIAVISAIKGGMSLALAIPFLLAVPNVRFSEIVRQALWTNVVCMLAIFCSCGLGIINDRIYDITRRERHSLGFDYTTTPSNYLMYNTLMYIFIRREKLTWWEAVLLEAVNFLLFMLTDTKSSFLVATLAIVLSICLKIDLTGKISTNIRRIAKYVSATGAAAIMLLAYLYEKSAFVSETLDGLLSGRIGLGSRAVKEYGFTLMGQEIEWVGIQGSSYYAEPKPYNYVDSSYLQILLSYGWIILILFLVGYYFLGKEIERENDKYFALVIVCSCIHCTFDPQLIWIHYNIFFAALGYLFISDRKERKKYMFQ